MPSTYSTRNALYLRVSTYKVIPLFLYLDERHVNWMSDDILDSVVEDLKDKMQSLLAVTRGTKKHRVHVERGEGYQYCYFLRNSSKTEVVLLKVRPYNSNADSGQNAPLGRGRQAGHRCRGQREGLQAGR